MQQRSAEIYGFLHESCKLRGDFSARWFKSVLQELTPHLPEKPRNFPSELQRERDGILSAGLQTADNHNILPPGTTVTSVKLDANMT